MEGPFRFSMEDAAQALGYGGLPKIETPERPPKAIDTWDMLIRREGVDDIPVQVEILSVYRGRSPYYEDGSRFPYDDDPSEVEFGDAYVTADAEPFTNGQSIELTSEELQQAQDDYFNQEGEN